MAARISGVSLSLDKATLSKEIGRRTRGIVGRFVESKVKRKVQKTVQVYYQNAVLQVQRNLTTGVPGYRQNGPRTITFNYPDGSAGRFVTQNWAALTQSYASRPPRSSVFWRKHFASRGSGRSTRTLLGDYKAQISRAVSVSSGSTRVEGQGQKSYTIEWEITLTKLKAPLSTYITESFLSAQELDVSLPAVDNRSIERIVYVEGRRPFISGMSAEIGRRMRIELQQSIT